MIRLLSSISDMLSVALRGRVQSPPSEQASTGALLGEVAANVSDEARDYDGDPRKPVVAPIAPRRAEESWERLEPVPAAAPRSTAPAAPSPSSPKPDARIEPGAEDKGWDILGGV